MRLEVGDVSGGGAHGNACLWGVGGRGDRDRYACELHIHGTDNLGLNTQKFWSRQPYTGSIDNHTQAQLECELDMCTWALEVFASGQQVCEEPTVAPEVRLRQCSARYTTTTPDLSY